MFLAKANSAYSDRQDIAKQNGSDTQTAWRCTGAAECKRMNDLREDQSSSIKWWGAMTGVAIAGAVTGTAVLIAHLLDSSPTKRTARPMLTPTLSHQEAGLQLQGTF